MDCGTYMDVVVADVEGRLDGAQAAAAREHLASCARCTHRRREAVALKERLRGSEADRQLMLASLEHSVDARAALPREARLGFLLASVVVGVVMLALLVRGCGAGGDAQRFRLPTVATEPDR
jgi:hypothetical protein